MKFNLYLLAALIELGHVSSFQSRLQRGRFQLKEFFAENKKRRTAPLHVSLSENEEISSPTNSSTYSNKVEEVSADMENKELIAQICAAAVVLFAAYSIGTFVLGTAINMVSSMTHALGDEVVKEAENVANFAGSAVGTVAGASYEAAKVVIPAVGKGVMAGAQAAAPVVQDMGEKISETASPYVQEASQRITEAATPLVQEASQRITEAATPLVQEASQKLSDAASPYVSAVDSTINSATATVDSTINNARDSVAYTLDATRDSVTSAVDSTIQSAADTVASTIQGVAGEAASSVKNVVPLDLFVK